MSWLALAMVALADPPLPTAPFEAPKYGRFALLADVGPTLEGGLDTVEHAAFVAELAARREAP